MSRKPQTKSTSLTKRAPTALATMDELGIRAAIGDCFFAMRLHEHPRGPDLSIEVWRDALEDLRQIAYDCHTLTTPWLPAADRQNALRRALIKIARIGKGLSVPWLEQRMRDSLDFRRRRSPALSPWSVLKWATLIDNLSGFAGDPDSDQCEAARAGLLAISGAFYHVWGKESALLWYDVERGGKRRHPLHPVTRLLREYPELRRRGGPARLRDFLVEAHTKWRRDLGPDVSPLDGGKLYALIKRKRK